MKRKILALAMTLILIVSATCICASAEEQNYVVVHSLNDTNKITCSPHTVNVIKDGGVNCARFEKAGAESWSKVTFNSDEGKAKHIAGMKYVYFYLETEDSQAFKCSIELIASSRWMSNKDSFEVLSASNLQAGWVKKTANSQYMTFDAGFTGWVRLEIANCTDGTGSAVDAWLWSIGMYINNPQTEQFTLGTFYFAAGDEDVPGLPDIPNVLTFNDLADTNEIWISASYPVKAEVFTDEGVNYGRFVPNSAEADKVGMWFYVTMGSGSGALDITGKKYAYFYLKTPASTDATFSFELRNDSAYMGNKNSYELLSVSNLQAGWVKKTFGGNNMTVAAGFDGWVRLEIANCYSSGDNPTYASNATDIKNIGMWINDSGRGDEALTFGVIYFAAGDDDVPGLPDIPDAPVDNLGVSLRESGDALRFVFAMEAEGVGYAAGSYEQAVANSNYVRAELTDASTVVIGGKSRQITDFGGILSTKTDPELTVDAVNIGTAKRVPAQRLHKVMDDGTVQFVITVINIPEANYDSSISVRPYVEYLNEGGETAYFYGDATACSVNKAKELVALKEAE